MKLHVFMTIRSSCLIFAFSRKTSLLLFCQDLAQDFLGDDASFSSGMNLGKCHTQHHDLTRQHLSILFLLLRIAFEVKPLRRSFLSRLAINNLQA